jgi:hypothetical protein
MNSEEVFGSLCAKVQRESLIVIFHYFVNDAADWCAYVTQYKIRFNYCRVSDWEMNRTVTGTNIPLLFHIN